MKPLGQLIADMADQGAGRWSVRAGNDWRQGRTLFGGLSAAFCFAACEKLVPDLPPLRSAQVAFVGPATGEATLFPRILRQGRSVTFLACDLLSDDVVATRALFAFGDTRPSAFKIRAAAAPYAPQPDACAPLFGDRYPAFAGHFDMRLASGSRPVTGATQGEMLVWARYRDANLPPGLTSLVALADALPPAAMTRLTGPAAISSITWQFDLFETEQFQPTEWILLQSREEAILDGYSGQSMALWGSDGRPLLIGRQSVAIFA